MYTPTLVRRCFRHLVWIAFVTSASGCTQDAPPLGSPPGEPDPGGELPSGGTGDPGDDDDGGGDDDDGPDTGDGETSDTGPGDTVIDDADEMYSLAHLPNFYLYLDEAGVEQLSSDDETLLKTYVSGSFRYRDQVIEDVGIRLKGNLTLTNLTKKPSFKVKFNKYNKGQKFLGLEALTLHNCHSDSSMVREHLTYKIFRESGVPASRTGYAQVYVNDELYGVYVNVETLDDEFLQRNYEDAKGNLYEGEHGDDLDGNIWGYEQDEGDDTSRDDLVELSDIALRDDDSLFFGDDAPLETDRVLDHIAIEAYVGHFDGYRASHNYFIYHEPTIDKWTWIPWSVDQTLIRKNSPFSGGGFVDVKCRHSEPCLLHYIDRGLQLVDRVPGMQLDAELDGILQLIDEAAHADPRKRHSNEKMESSQKSVRNFLEDRSDGYEASLDCLVDGIEPDEDGDGFGPCFQDCNDNDPSIHPDAPELCDGIDNDCSGFADDVPECPCPSEVVDGTTFYFCEHVRKWTAARSFCTAQGHQLAKFETREQHDAVWAIARDKLATKWAFGLNDRSTENTYVWADGTAPTFTSWASGEPAHALAWFDCVFFSGSTSATWRERNCSSTGPFICSAIE